MVLTRKSFLDLSSEVTGFSAFDLEGTGLVDAYHKLIEDVIGPELAKDLAAIIGTVLGPPAGSAERQAAVDQGLMPSPRFWPVISGLISLWYLGTWNQLPDQWYADAGLPPPAPDGPGRTHVPSELSYTEQLSYRAAHAHPPGAKPTGFASWSEPPVSQQWRFASPPVAATP